MTIRIGINGLGRIGRCIVRALYEEQRSSSEAVAHLELVAVNSPASAETHAHLLKYDSVHGRFHGKVAAEGDNLSIDGKTLPVYRHRDPKQIPWGKLGVDIVFECTGKFNNKADAALHLEAGAKKVIISAPAENVDATIVYGVNNSALHKDHRVISIGSCTTNALAPVAKILQENVSIEAGFMTTIHSYTGDQNLVDNSHKDFRRARSAALSMIPTSTGAAKTIGLILPELKGKLDGIAIRVPTPNVSLIDLCITAARDTTKEEINAAFEKAAAGPLKGVLGISKEPLVSIDLTHSLESSIVDLAGTNVVGKRLVRVASWYDNEWAFSNRMLDVARLFSS